MFSLLDFDVILPKICNYNIACSKWYICYVTMSANLGLLVDKNAGFRSHGTVCLSVISFLGVDSEWLFYGLSRGILQYGSQRYSIEIQVL